MDDIGGAQPRLNRLGRLLRWLLLGTRPPFHTAVWVLFGSAVTLPAAWLAVLVRRAFGEAARLDYEMLAAFAGPLGAGALVSAAYELVAGGRANHWISCAVFGGASTFVFMTIVHLRFDEALDLSRDDAAMAVGGALLFLLIRWLALLERRGQKN